MTNPIPESVWRAAFPKTVAMAGEACPKPMLALRKFVRDMCLPGEQVKFITSDRNTVADFEAFCQQNGHKELWRVQNGQETIFMMEVSNGSV